MAEAAKEQDQSMEEILQSIKRIIADEGDAAAAAPAPAPEEEPAPVAAPSPAADVLELTDMLADDGSVRQAKGDIPPVPMMSIDEIMAAPISSEAAAETLAAPATAPAPEPVVAAPAPAEEVAEDSLISEVTRAASVAALRALEAAPAPPPGHVPGVIPFRSGNTVEDIVLEALRPMLKDWLDDNLTGIVERLVDREVRKLSSLR